MSSEQQALLLRWLLTAGIAFLAFELSRTGIADFLRLEPCAYLDSVQASAKRPDPARLGVARDRLVLARKFDPDNPIIHEYLGIIYFHRAVIVANDLPLRIGYLETARNYYETALALRPNSGYLWAGMVAIRGALLDSRQSQTTHPADDARRDGMNDLHGLKQALQHATQLAPWEAPVLNIVVKTGMLHYKALDLEERGMVDAAVGRANKLKLPIISMGYK